LRYVQILIGIADLDALKILPSLERLEIRKIRDSNAILIYLHFIQSDDLVKLLIQRTVDGFPELVVLRLATLS